MVMDGKLRSWSITRSSMLFGREILTLRHEDCESTSTTVIAGSCCSSSTKRARETMCQIQTKCLGSRQRYISDRGRTSMNCLPELNPSKACLPKSDELFYGGGWHRPIDGRYMPVTDPSTGAGLGR